MTLPRLLVFTALAIVAWVGGPSRLSAQPYDPREYKTPTPDVPADPIVPDPLTLPPDQGPPAVPDVTFRDRLLKLQAVTPGANARTATTTPDTTSSYTTSLPANNATRDTTSSYTTGDGAKH